MKVLTSLLLLFFSLGTKAADIDQALRTYCHDSYSNKMMSEFAMANDGHYLERNPDSETTIFKGYKGCRFDTPWIKSLHELLCNGVQANPVEVIRANISEVSTPKILLFFFDGAADFNAPLAYQTLKPVNLDGTEGIDLLGNGHGLNILTLFLTNQNEHVKKYRNDIELHYHSGSGFKYRENYASAATCAQEIKYYLDVYNQVTAGPKAEPKWIAMGYSNGGAMTIDFQREVPIDLAITVDPIVQAHLYGFHKLKKTIGKKISSTKRFVNFYQSTDNHSVPILHLRGKPVVDADVNYEVNSTNSNLTESGELNHVYIAMDPTVVNKIVCEFGNLMGKNNKCIE